MSGQGIESVDEKLTAAFQRRERAQDDLIRALTAIDTATTRIGVLIDRKLEDRKKAATLKTTTTTREYDADGHMVKETVTEYDSGPAVVGSCSCHLHGYCPLHGYTPQWWQVVPNVYSTITSSDTTYTINYAAKAALSR